MGIQIFGGQSRLQTFTWATKPATYPTGQPAFISDMGTKGGSSFFDGTRWKPQNGSIVMATLDATSGNIANSDTIVFQYLIPANLLQNGDRIRVSVSVTKSGTTDNGIMKMFLGTAGTTGDTIIETGTLMTTTVIQAGVIYDFRLISATSIQPLARKDLGYGGGSTAALQAPVTITSAAANALYISVSIASSSTNNTVAMTGGEISLIASAN